MHCCICQKNKHETDWHKLEHIHDPTKYMIMCRSCFSIYNQDVPPKWFIDQFMKLFNANFTPINILS